MAVIGLDLFQERFADFEDAFILIGGAACELWFAEQNLEFRLTKDLDIVLILDRLTPEFMARFWRFIDDGRYKIKRRNEDGPPVLYRFEKSPDKKFPFRVELFCRTGDELVVPPGQNIVPLRMEDAQSLSAILLDEHYYRFLLRHCRVSRGIHSADGMALIPLKARAWLDLTDRKAHGLETKGDDIKKHRNDVFRLAVTLPGDPGDELPEQLSADLAAFLSQFPEGHSEWANILKAIRRTTGGDIPVASLIDAIRTYYRLPS
jgi:hypothetical protein